MPPAVILPTGCSYAQAATTSPLDGADWGYVAKGGAQRPMVDKYSGAHTWEAKDGLSGSGGFCFFDGEAKGACVADTRIVIKPRECMCINPATSTYMCKCAKRLMRNIVSLSATLTTPENSYFNLFYLIKRRRILMDVF